MSKRVRVRFAPSPTGPLHIGGVRTALYNYLFAKKKGGDFLLRIEDTDQTRYVEGAEEYIVESLKWCGIEPNEGFGVGGEYGPYRQSERKSIYKKYADQLVENGFAYYAFDTPEELDQMRERLKEEGATHTQYGPSTRMQMKNSLSLSLDTVKELISSIPYVIRFKMPETRIVKMYDIIRENVEVDTSTLDDKVLFKSDGLPTYHLANVVDDYLMKISHVIRGEEWLPSLPLHWLLYESFGWENDRPEFAHLPLLLKPSGNGKLSKRDGDKLGFPVFPLEWKDPQTGEISSGYKEKGYEKDGFINMLAFLGWNPGTEQEIFSIDELADVFDIDRVGKSGARFDPDKAKWFNQQYLKQKTADDLYLDFNSFLIGKNINKDESYIKRVIELVKERIDFANELFIHSDFFFEAPKSYDEQIVKKRWKEGVNENLTALCLILEEQQEFNSEHLSLVVKKFIEYNDLNMGQIMNCLRLSLVGKAAGPDLFIIIEMLGKEETINRISRAIEIINK